MEYKIIDAEGNEIPRDQPGEVCFRGPNIMLGNFCRSPNNMKAILTTRKQQEKLSLTTDSFERGILDMSVKTSIHTISGSNRRNFWLTDRVKDLIKVKGFQVAPAELEDTLMNHQAIIDAGVSRTSFLRPSWRLGHWSDKDFTEYPRAYVVLHSDYSPSAKMEKEICDWLATRVIHYKQLRGGVVFVEKVPKTASGKVKFHFDSINGRYWDVNWRICLRLGRIWRPNYNGRAIVRLI